MGSWTIMAGGGSPTGITLDPANVNHLWIVDKSTDRIYQFNAAATLTLVTSFDVGKPLAQLASVSSADAAINISSRSNA